MTKRREDLRGDVVRPLPNALCVEPKDSPTEALDPVLTLAIAACVCDAVVIPRPVNLDRDAGCGVGEVDPANKPACIVAYRPLTRARWERELANELREFGLKDALRDWLVEPEADDATRAADSSSLVAPSFDLDLQTCDRRQPATNGVVNCAQQLPLAEHGGEIDDRTGWERYRDGLDNAYVAIVESHTLVPDDVATLASAMSKRRDLDDPFLRVREVPQRSGRPVRRHGRPRQTCCDEALTP